MSLTNQQPTSLENQFGSQLDQLRSFVVNAEFDFDSIQSLPDEGSARRYFRLSKSTQPAHTAILCLDHPFIVDSSDFVRLTNFLYNAGASVPRIIAMNEAGWFIVEDGGKQTLAQLWRNNLEAGDIAFKAALQELSKWHSLNPPSLVTSRSFDFDKLFFEIEFLFARLANVSQIIGIDLKPSFELSMFLRSVCEHLGQASPKVFTHRDFHSRNILVPDASNPAQVVFIDHQDARLGLPWYDVSSLLYDPYIDLSLEKRRDYLDYYRELTGHKKNQDQNRYYLQAMQRILKALGSFLFLSFEKQKWFYVESIEPALRRLEEIVLLGHFPDTVFLFAKDMRTKYLPAIKEAAKLAQN